MQEFNNQVFNFSWSIITLGESSSRLHTAKMEGRTICISFFLRLQMWGLECTFLFEADLLCGTAALPTYSDIFLLLIGSRQRCCSQFVYPSSTNLINIALGRPFHILMGILLATVCLETADESKIILLLQKPSKKKVHFEDFCLLLQALFGDLSSKQPGSSQASCRY